MEDTLRELLDIKWNTILIIPSSQKVKREIKGQKNYWKK